MVDEILLETLKATLQRCKSTFAKRVSDPILMDRSIGGLFRAYGEQYIKIYKPSLHKIKLIRSIRVCKTPALGGRRIDCNDCGNKHYVYFSCGQNQCPICQSIKRTQWQDKLGAKLLNVPYVHMVFT